MVDILMATYNGESFVGQQLKSIWNQTCTDWQLVIHDDCSTDETISVIQRAIGDASCHDKVTVEVNAIPCKGAAANFMGLLQCAKSEYAMFCDQDDVWHSDKLDVTLDAMKKAEVMYGSHTPLLIYTDLKVVDENLQMIAESFVDYMKVPPALKLSRLLMQNSVTGCTMMMNKPLYQLMQKTVSYENIVMHDHWAALLATTFGKAVFVNTATLDYRQHSKNSVGAANARSFSYLWHRLKLGKEKFRLDMSKAMLQAETFYNIYGASIKNEKKQNLILGFAQLQNKSKVDKIKFYLKNGVVKYGWIRAVMQMLWS